MDSGIPDASRLVAVPNEWQGVTASTQSVSLPEPPPNTFLAERLAASRAPKSYLTGEGPRYVEVKELGRGGMGIVYDVEDRDLRRHVAFKTLAPSIDDESSTHRFLREARITAQLSHPNIVPVYDFGAAEDGRWFYSMPVLNGHSLGKIVRSLDDRSGPERLPELVDVLLKVCDAVEYAHHRGVLHRDLKPDNIFVGDYGEVRVLDWGVARRVGANGAEESFERGLTTVHGTAEGAEDPRFTCLGQVVGTLAYMAPEQAAGRLGEIDARTDVYALGGVLFTILTGRPPRSAARAAELIEMAITGETPLAFARRQWPIPAALASICDRALSPRRQDRYQSVREMADAIRAARLQQVRGAAGKVVLALMVGTATLTAASIGLACSLGGALTVHWTFWAAIASCAFGLAGASTMEAMSQRPVETPYGRR